MDTNIEHIIKVDEIIHSMGALQALKRKLQDGERDPEKLGEVCDRIVAATQKVISESGEEGEAIAELLRDSVSDTVYFFLEEHNLDDDFDIHAFVTDRSW